MYWIVNKNKTHLLKEVNKILINLKDNHFINRICNSWFKGKNICTGH
jgi:ABC-type amino acid transport substrate-binding protein